MLYLHQANKGEVVSGVEMPTKMLTPADIDEAAALLRRGECVAFPTETVYGLGANALSQQAVAKIFIAKGRPADNPLIVHCHAPAQLTALVAGWPPEAELLISAFWPGPLTLVLPKRETVPKNVTGGLDTVAVRIPDHPVALALLRTAQLPVAAPSANVSGKPSPTRSSHVWHDLKGKIAAIIDGGETGWGVESTVLDCTTRPFRLLRPGAITVEQLRQHVEIVVPRHLDSDSLSNPPSPGMKYKHYSPEARVVLVTGANIRAALHHQAEATIREGLKTVVLAFTENLPAYPGVDVMDMGSRDNLQVVAARIYHLLRKADHLGYQVVLVEGLPEADLGLTIMNRLRKAADIVVQT